MSIEASFSLVNFEDAKAWVSWQPAARTEINELLDQVSGVSKDEVIKQWCPVTDCVRRGDIYSMSFKSRLLGQPEVWDVTLNLEAKDGSYETRGAGAKRVGVMSDVCDLGDLALEGEYAVFQKCLRFHSSGTIQKLRNTKFGKLEHEILYWKLGFTEFPIAEL